MMRIIRCRLWKCFAAVFVAAGLLQGCNLGWAGTDIERTFQKRTYPGSRDRQYIVHLPTDYDVQDAPFPLVMVLHGCKQDHRTIKHDTGFDVIADEETFIAVYPFITSYDGLRGENCWGWWMNENIREGTGEVQDLAGIVEEVQQSYQVDPERIHIAGLSSGAGMAVAAMVAHSELIASGCSTAGVPYSETSWGFFSGTLKPVDEIAAAMIAEMGEEKRPVPIFIIQSEQDQTVKFQYAENIRDSWGLAFGFNTENPVWSDSGVTKGTPWTHTKFEEVEGRTVAETFFLKGLPHGWYGGEPGQYSFPDAPNTAQLAWDFFQVHPLHPNRRPDLTIGSITVDQANRRVQVAGTVADDGPLNNLSIQVELLGLSPQEPKPVAADAQSGEFEFSSSSGLTNDQYYRPRAMVSDAHGASVTVLAAPVALGDPSTRPPQLSIDVAGAEGDRVQLSGKVSDDVGIAAVDVRYHQQGAWRSADINGDNWSYTDRGLSAGTHVLEVRATDREALDTTKTTNVTIVDPYDEKRRSDISAHVTASRIRMYGTRFGTADQTYLELFERHGALGEFWLYRARNTDDWYADLSNMRQSAGPAVDTAEPLLNTQPLGQGSTQRDRLRQLLRELLEELDRE